MLRYLTNRNPKSGMDDPGLAYGLRLPLKEVRYGCRLEGYNARLSSFINRRKSKSYTHGFRADDAFESLVQPHIDAGELNPETALAGFRAFLRVKGLEDEWRDISDFRQCLTSVFRDVFPRHSPPPDAGGLRTQLRGQRLQRSAHFTARDAGLSAIDALLHANGAAVLYGLGGIGKTMLAEEYARRSTHAVCQVVTAEPSYTSYRDVIRAIRFENVPPDSGTADPVEAQMERLAALDESALTVLDGIDCELTDQALLDRLFKACGAHIILTTRRADLAAQNAAIEIGPLESDGQLHLFCAAVGNVPSDAEERAAAEEICRRSGGHTLLIELLGRTCRVHGLTARQMLGKLDGLAGMSAYRERVRIHKDDLNETMQIRDFVSDILFRLEPMDDTTRALLGDLTILPLDGVPRSLFTTEPFTLPEDRLAEVEQRGWLLPGHVPDSVRLHPVVREAILAQIHVDSGSCTAFLEMVWNALHKIDAMEEPSSVLRLAASAVDMLYIGDALRDLLVSGRLNPLTECAWEVIRTQNVWRRLQGTFSELAAGAHETEDIVRFTLYALLCESMHILYGEDDAPGSIPAQDLMDAAEQAMSDDRAPRLTAVLQAMTELFSSFHESELTDPAVREWTAVPMHILELTAAVTGAEMTDYVRQAGLEITPDAQMDAITSMFRMISPEDDQLLRSVSEPLFSAFLEQALDTLQRYFPVLSVTASASVHALVLLHALLQLGASHIASLEDARIWRGWQFPGIAYLPKGFSLVSFTYSESTWDQPSAVLVFRRGKKTLYVTMERVTSDSAELNEFEIMESHELERMEERIIRARGSAGSPAQDVQAELGPWRVRIASPNGVHAKQLIRIAQGLTLPASAP